PAVESPAESGTYVVGPNPEIFYRVADVSSGIDWGGTQIRIGTGALRPSLATEKIAVSGDSIRIRLADLPEGENELLVKISDHVGNSADISIRVLSVGLGSEIDASRLRVPTHTNGSLPLVLSSSWLK